LVHTRMRAWSDGGGPHGGRWRDHGGDVGQPRRKVLISHSSCPDDDEVQQLDDLPWDSGPADPSHWNAGVAGGCVRFDEMESDDAMEVVNLRPTEKVVLKARSDRDCSSSDDDERDRRMKLPPARSVVELRDADAARHLEPYDVDAAGTPYGWRTDSPSFMYDSPRPRLMEPPPPPPSSRTEKPRPVPTPPPRPARPQEPVLQPLPSRCSSPQPAAGALPPRPGNAGDGVSDQGPSPGAVVVLETAAESNSVDGGARKSNADAASVSEDGDDAWGPDWTVGPSVDMPPPSTVEWVEGDGPSAEVERPMPARDGVQLPADSVGAVPVTVCEQPVSSDRRDTPLAEPAGVGANAGDQDTVHASSGNKVSALTTKDGSPPTRILLLPPPPPPPKRSSPERRKLLDEEPTVTEIGQRDGTETGWWSSSRWWHNASPCRDGAGSGRPSKRNGESRPLPPPPPPPPRRKSHRDRRRPTSASRKRARRRSPVWVGAPRHSRVRPSGSTGSDSSQHGTSSERRAAAHRTLSRVPKHVRKCSRSSQSTSSSKSSSEHPPPRKKRDAPALAVRCAAVPRAASPLAKEPSPQRKVSRERKHPAKQPPEVLQPSTCLPVFEPGLHQKSSDGAQGMQESEGGAASCGGASSSTSNDCEGNVRIEPKRVTPIASGDMRRSDGPRAEAQTATKAGDVAHAVATAEANAVGERIKSRDWDLPAPSSLPVAPVGKKKKQQADSKLSKEMPAHDLYGDRPQKGDRAQVSKKEKKNTKHRFSMTITRSRHTSV